MKNVDWAEVFTKNKNNIINAVIILAALIVSFNIFLRQNKQMAALEERKNQEMQKNQVLIEIAELEKKEAVYKKEINSKDISSIINRIGSIAKSASVDMVSIRPEKAEDRGNYTKYNFQFTINSDSYHKLGGFVSQLENSADIYFVDSLQINVQAQKETEPARLSASFVISTILLKG